MFYIRLAVIEGPQLIDIPLFYFVGHDGERSYSVQLRSVKVHQQS